MKIAVWDSGVDTTLFPTNLATANGSVPVIAFDRFAEPAKGELQAIPDALKSKVPQMKARLKGFSDLQSNIDSPEASEVKSTCRRSSPTSTRRSSRKSASPATRCTARTSPASRWPAIRMRGSSSAASSSTGI